MAREKIVQYPALFPFAVEDLSQADMAASEWLTLEQMGDNAVIRVKA